MKIHRFSALSYVYVIAASSMLFFVLPVLICSSEIVPNAIVFSRIKSPVLASILEQYGDGCISEERKLELYEKALDMRVQASEKDEKTAETIRKIWEIKRYWPQYKTTWRKKEFDAKAAILGVDSEETIRDRTTWAIQLSHQGKHKDSSNLMRDNLKYLKQAKGDQDHAIVSMLLHMNGIFKANDEPLKERADLLEEAVEICSHRKWTGYLGMEEINSHHALAELLSEMHESAEAEKHFKIALALSEGQCANMRRRSLRVYADFLSKAGQKGKAQLYYSQMPPRSTWQCESDHDPTIWSFLRIPAPF